MLFFNKKKSKKDATILLNKIMSNKVYKSLSSEDIEAFYDDNFFNDFIELYKERIKNEKLNVTLFIQLMNDLLSNNSIVFIKFLEKMIEIPEILDKYDDCAFRLNANNLDKEYYRKLIDIFTFIISKYDNCLAFHLLSIMFNNDVRCKEMKMDDKNEFINVLNDKISFIIEFEDKEENYVKLDMCNLALKFLKNNYNDVTIEIINKINLDKIPHFLKYTIIDFKLANDFNIKEKDMNKLLENIEDTYYLIAALENNDKMNLLPKNSGVNQEMIARYALINWLEYPTELGKKPDTIELLEVLQLKDFDAYVYAFTSNDCNDNKKTLGVSGFYHRGDLTTKCYGSPFSNFEIVGNDYKEQLNNLLDKVEEWKDAYKENN